jgi:t-SNARE complex subunit (syntaxin)
MEPVTNVSEKPAEHQEVKREKTVRPRGKFRWSRWLLYAIILIAVLAVIDFLYQLNRGAVYVGTKDPKQQVVVRTIVCGDEMMQQFNDKMKETGFDQGMFVGIAKEITKLPHYNDDVNCTYMLAFNAMTTNNTEDLEKSLNRLDEFSKEGLYPSNQVRHRSIVTATDFRTFMQILFAPPATEGE